MLATLDTSALGMPVEIGQIGREIKKLWELDGGVSTRASLINFAVYCEGLEAMGANTEQIIAFTREHACRAILIGHDATASEPKVQAWINAHCHLSRAGAKQVCCEQISFLFEGPTKDRIPNILFSNLDSDLPLYLWWQGEFPNPIDEQLWAWVDRLIFDSQSWSNPREQFALLRNSLESAKSRLTLCDLNWTRSLHLRQAAAQMFDHPENLKLLAGLQTISIAHSPEHRFTALLLVGWFASQLKLELLRNDSTLVFTGPTGNEVTVTLTAEEGRSISRCELTNADSSLALQRDGTGDFFRVEVQLPGDRQYRHLLPAGSSSTSSLLLEEIDGGGHHRVYLKALDISENLL
jgi:glucose-6-phosphate dehydrogenase assembly protein OpcA